MYKIYQKNIFNILIIFSLPFLIYSQSSFGNEVYFDLSDQEIEIQTNFKGKEVIIFGLSEPGFETIISIKGPEKDTIIRKKERIFMFWFNTKKIIYRNLPSIFFIASTAPIKSILNEDTIIKNSLYFNESMINIMKQRNFNFNKKNKIDNWNNNLIKIKKEENFYKEYNIKIVENKLFQTRIFFPSNTIPGKYNVNIFQVKDKIIFSKKNKKIIIKKTGVGSKIFKFAHEHPVGYGIISILLALCAGLIAATAFRRL